MRGARTCGQEKARKRVLHSGERHKGIPAGTVRALIENAENRERVAVLNAGYEVAFAGNRNDAAWAALHHNAAGNGPPRGEREAEAEPVPQVEQGPYLAGAAAPAILRLRGNAVPAAAVLDAMRQEQQEVARGHADALRKHQLIVDLDKGAAHRRAPDAADAPETVHDGQDEPEMPGRRRPV